MYINLLKNLSKEIEYYFDTMEAVYNFDHGPEFEIALCKILHKLLPAKFGVCRGFICDKNGNKAGDDIIIYDKLRFPTIRMLDMDFALKEQIPIEAVYCYIEAKHNLELNDTENSTFNKALSQIGTIKKLSRPDRPLTQITEVINLTSITPNRPAEWPHILNPIHTSIISRKTSVCTGKSTKKILNQELTYDILNKKKIFLENMPDLIVAGEGTILLHSLKKDETEVFLPFYLPDNDTVLHRIFKTKYSALATGLCQILWALERIQLGTMPWEEIICNSLHGTRLKT